MCMFELELERVISEIESRGSKRVLLQLPDGLKPQAKQIADAVTSKTGAEALIWFGSCFGHCDMPLGLDVLKVDLMVQWGHNRYHKTREDW